MLIVLVMEFPSRVSVGVADLGFVLVFVRSETDTVIDSESVALTSSVRVIDGVGGDGDIDHSFV